MKLHRSIPIAFLLFVAVSLSAQTTGHGTTLSWTASTSATACSSPCTFGYNVYRGTAAGTEGAAPINAAPITGTTYFDPVTLTSSTQTFFYTVEAVETVGGVTVNSAPSNEVSVTFPGTPAAPASVVAVPK